MVPRPSGHMLNGFGSETVPSKGDFALIAYKAKLGNIEIITMNKKLQNIIRNFTWI